MKVIKDIKASIAGINESYTGRNPPRNYNSFEALPNKNKGNNDSFKLNAAILVHQ